MRQKMAEIDYKIGVQFLQTDALFTEVGMASCDPAAGFGCYRDDWKHVYIYFDGELIDPSTCAEARSTGQDRFARMYLINPEIGGYDLDTAGQPKTQKISPANKIQIFVPTNYDPSRERWENAKRSEWWYV